MSDLTHEGRVARAFSEYPELKHYIRMMLAKVEDTGFRDLIKQGSIAYSRDLFEELLFQYEVNLGQKFTAGNRGQIPMWEIYQLTRLFDGLVLRVGQMTQHGKITRMYEERGWLTINVESEGITSEVELIDFAWVYF